MADSSKIKTRLVSSLVALAALLGIFTLYLWFHTSADVAADQLPAPCRHVVDSIRQDRTAASTGCGARRWYLAQVERIGKIDSLLAQADIPLAQRARCAYSIRFQARVEARQKMPSRFAVVRLRYRDLLEYGNVDGPTFAGLLGAGGNRASYLRIIASAQQTNQQANAACADTP